MLLLFLIKSVPSVMASVWSSAKCKDDASDELKRSFQSRYACMRQIRCSKHYRQCFWFGKSGLRSHHRQYTPKVKLTLIRIKSQLSWKIKSPPCPLTVPTPSPGSCHGNHPSQFTALTQLPLSTDELRQAESDSPVAELFRHLQSARPGRGDPPSLAHSCSVIQLHLTLIWLDTKCCDLLYSPIVFKVA